MKKPDTELLKPVGVIPLNDRLVVRRVKEREFTASGLKLVDSAKEKPYYGVVLSAGETVSNPYLQHGSVMITFGKYAGTEITVDGEDVLTMREEEVSGIVADVKLVEQLLAYGA